MLRTSLTDLLGIARQYAGQGVGLVREERPAAELVAGLAAGAELLRGWG
jgi:hypothetical protein